MAILKCIYKPKVMVLFDKSNGLHRNHSYQAQYHTAHHNDVQLKDWFFHQNLDNIVMASHSKLLKKVSAWPPKPRQPPTQWSRINMATVPATHTHTPDRPGSLAVNDPESTWPPSQLHTHTPDRPGSLAVNGPESTSTWPPSQLHTHTPDRPGRLAVNGPESTWPIPATHTHTRQASQWSRINMATVPATHAHTRQAREFGSQWSRINMATVPATHTHTPDRPGSLAVSYSTNRFYIS